MTVYAAKNALRKKVLNALDMLSPEQCDAASVEINRVLQAFLAPYLAGSRPRLLTWYAHFPGEIDTASIARFAFRGAEVYLPVVGGENGLAFYRVDENEFSQLSCGAFGIPEPRQEPSRRFQLPDSAGDIILVPGLAFDNAGRRLGRGKGCYDRFLAQSSATTVGVCFASQLVERIPVAEHDKCVQWVCTERGVVRATLDEFTE